MSKSVGERLRWWALGRPLLSYVVPARLIVFPPRYYYIVRHPKFPMYWRDPYMLRPNQSRHLAQWGKVDQAWRFGSAEQATQLLAESYGKGIIETIQFDE